MHSAIAPRLLDWLSRHSLANSNALRYCLHILISGKSPDDALAKLAKLRLGSESDFRNRAKWTALLVDTKPVEGISSLTSTLRMLEDETTAAEFAQEFLVSLVGERRSSEPRLMRFNTPNHLASLYLLMHRYISTNEDIDRLGGGVYSPGLRDHSQTAREVLLRMLCAIPGNATYLALQNLAKAHPNPTYSRWIAKRARERAVEDSDLKLFSVSNVLEFLSEQEVTPTTNKELFELGCSRLIDFKDWLERGNDSPAETYRRVGDETEMRNLIASWLNLRSHNRYSCAQEPELANSQRPDIWLQSASVSSAVPIELKLAHRWSGPELCERLENQLAGDYLREANPGHGIFLLVFTGTTKPKKWKIGSRKVAFASLPNALEDHWLEIAFKFPNVDAVSVIGVDLTVRGQRSDESKKTELTSQLTGPETTN